MDSKKTAVIRTVVILYSVWLAFYLVCRYFKILSLPDDAASYAFMAAAFAAALIVSVRIEELRYSPFILIIVFALSGRLIGFIGNFISIMVSRKALFMLPFGGLDFFLFNLLMLGMFRYAALSEAGPAEKKFHAASLIPIVLFTAPVLLNLLPSGVNGETVYSFIFTAFGAMSAGVAVSYGLNFPGKRRFAVAVIASVCADMLTYLELSPLSAYLPPGLSSLLLPYALLMLAFAAAGITKDEIYD